MGKRLVSSIDASLHISQLDPQARSMLMRTALRQHMAELGRKSNNQDPAKREIIRKAQLKRWADWRAAKLAEQHAYNASKGLPLDTPMPKPVRPKKIKQISRREALDIAYAEMTKIWPNGPAPHEMEAFKAWKPKDPRVQKYL